MKKTMIRRKPLAIVGLATLAWAVTFSASAAAASTMTPLGLPSSPPWAVTIVMGIVSLVLVIAATLLLLRRKRSQQPEGTDTLDNFITKATERTPTVTRSGTIPAIPVFTENRPSKNKKPPTPKV